MKKKQLGLGILCMICFSAISANTSIKGTDALKEDVKETPEKKDARYSLSALAEYNDFKYNSSNSTNFYHFSGHTDLYLFGANDAKITDKLTGGVLLYSTKTSLKSKAIFYPQRPVNTHQDIRISNLAAHIVRAFKEHSYVDVMGGYGHGDMQNSTALSDGTQHSNAKGDLHNWFASVSGGDVRSWRQFLIRSTITLLFSDVNQQSFNVHSAFTPTTVASLINKSTYLLENAEITYQKSEKIQPFVSGGLLQVLQFSNSRPVISNVAVVGSLPEFNLDQNGFRIGAGLSYHYKQFSVRVEQQYDQRGTVYHNNQSIITLGIALA
ncbi:MAG: autotransporter outer membrane beta-barrel domain-containing protein [Legionellales bacterium]